MVSLTISAPTLSPGRYFHEVECFLTNGVWQAPRPSLEHIAELSRHFARLPYENLSKIIRLNQYPDYPPLRLPDVLLDEFQRQHLGGTCYALTFFLTTILQFHGYDARPVTAEMNRGKDVHSAVIINFKNQRYLLDPGYLIHQPLPLSRMQSHRLDYPYLSVELVPVPESGDFSVFTYRKGRRTWRYRFSSQPLDWSTFAERWRKSFELPARSGLVLTRGTPTGMVYIHNDYLRLTEVAKVYKARDVKAVEKTIAVLFGIPMAILEEARRENQTRK